MTQPYNHIAIIGIGLIGSSLALATKRILPDTHISLYDHCLLYTSPSPRDVEESRMPSSA